MILYIGDGIDMKNYTSLFKRTVIKQIKEKTTCFCNYKKPKININVGIHLETQVYIEFIKV
jgi:hypothetical protein